MHEPHLTYTCYRFVAIGRNQPILCENTYQSHSCYESVAIALKNESICDYIDYYGPGPDTVMSCKSAVQGVEIEETIIYNSLEECTTLDNNLKYGCVLQFAVADKNVSLCSDLLTSSYQNQCIVGVAVATEDTFLCETILFELDKELCYSKIAIKTMDPDLCSYITAEDSKNYCLAYSQIKEPLLR